MLCEIKFQYQLIKESGIGYKINLFNFIQKFFKMSDLFVITDFHKSGPGFVTINRCTLY